MPNLIALIDMDCFYAQVDAKRNPEYRGKPLVVCGFSNQGERMAMAVSYEARAFGIRRGMSEREFLPLCPTVSISQIPTTTNIGGVQKADISHFRAASDEVFRVLGSIEDLVVEKASVDEAFLDLSAIVEKELKEKGESTIVDELLLAPAEHFPSTFLASGNDLIGNEQTRINALIAWIDNTCRLDSNQLRVALAAKVVEQIRRRILEETQFESSAGIGPNKMLAKVVCARHKPRKQTIILPQYVSILFDQTPIASVRNLGGKLGQALQDRFGVKTMSDLKTVPYADLLKEFPKDAVWLTKLVEGEDDEPIRPGTKPASIATSKFFPGSSALKETAMVKKWVASLVSEFSKRLFADQSKYDRTASSFTIGLSFDDDDCPRATHTVKLSVYHDAEKLTKMVWNFVRSTNKETTIERWYPPVRQITLRATLFKERVSPLRNHTIASWFRANSELCPQKTKLLPPPTTKAEKRKSVENEVLTIDEEDDEEGNDRPTTSKKTTVSKSKTSKKHNIFETKGKEQGTSSNSTKKKRSSSSLGIRPFTPGELITIDEEDEEGEAVGGKQPVGNNNGSSSSAIVLDDDDGEVEELPPPPKKSLPSPKENTRPATSASSTSPKEPSEAGGKDAKKNDEGGKKPAQLSPKEKENKENNGNHLAGVNPRGKVEKGGKGKKGGKKPAAVGQKSIASFFVPRTTESGKGGKFREQQMDMMDDEIIQID